ncbi:tripartite tricarboxylate transporter TctB family protein [Kushneria phyllosphaerae]|uniref:5,10-methylene-tetrahydrofolate dehydrogenase n=1 Tax=Kushneria phyllosphaerae TaxID=2100822 RepID=A0A2R8CJ93_9GAMM|nr:tripartite tricarboxylate transporter TctB family protein [Kushneria phyllosphaerae]SPJ32814.1 hypothetical protein KSP9073_00815 [Kushneria phyllosphaerae]
MTSSHKPTPQHERSCWVLGILPAPELPTLIVDKIRERLTEQLSRQVASDSDWRIETITDPMVGTDEDADDIINEAERFKREQSWTYVVCLTDLPLFHEGKPLAASASGNRGVAILSQPALGASPIARRVEEAIIQLVSELHFGSSREGRDACCQYHNRTRRGQRREAQRLVRRRLSEWVAPFVRHDICQEDSDLDVRFMARFKVPGYVKLIGGMVRANRPWSIFPAFRRIGAAAFATGAYGMIFNSMWRLADSYEPWRFVTLMLLSMLAMVVWIMIDHGLWEPVRHKNAFSNANLYNIATVSTLGIGVLFYYLMLTLLFFATAFLFVPAAVMGQTLGHEVGALEFAALGWLAASLATVGGALGSGLESDDTVRNATYGYRQQLRQKRLQEQRDSNKDNDDSEDSEDPEDPEKAEGDPDDDTKSQDQTNDGEREAQDQQRKPHQPKRSNSQRD